MQFQYDRSFKFKLNEDVWEAYLLTDQESKELDSLESDEEDKSGEGEDFPGMILPNKKCLFLVEGHVTLEYIGHELLHMFVESMYLGSANLDTEQFEEVMAEFLGYNVDKFIKIRNKLYRRYKKLEGA